MNQTQRFDPSLCTTLTDSFRKACDNASDNAKCMQGLKQYCTNEIYTMPEFELNKQYLDCSAKCNKDKTCVRKCTDKLTRD